jgi:hypothetical protein
MILTYNLDLIYKLDRISRIKEGNIRQNFVIAKSLRHLDGGKGFLIHLPLNFRTANNYLNCFSLLDAIAHPY